MQYEDYTLEKIADKACQQLLETGEHPPYIVVKGTVQSKPGILILPLAGLSEDPKEAAHMARMGGTIMRKETHVRPEHVFHISEAWAEVAPLDNLPAKFDPINSPNRIELLFVLDYDVATKESRVLSFKMTRDAKGELIEISPLHEKAELVPVGDGLLTAFLKGIGI